MNTTDLEAIRKAVEEFKTNLSDLSNDQTESAAQEALATAESAAAKLEADDHSKTPEQLVDERIEAERAVSIARLRLSRAKSEAITRRSRVFDALDEPSEKVAKNLREVAPLRQAKLITDLKAILGEDLAGLKGELESVAYRRAEEMFGWARTIEKTRRTDEHAGVILKALTLLEAAP